MVTVPECTEETIKRIAVALRKATLGKSVAFVFEEGMHRIKDDGKLFSIPNGSITFRLFVNGGAKDSGAPVEGAVAVEALHPALEADASE